MNEGSRAVTIIPPTLRGQKAVPAALHVDPADVERMTSNDARGLARALLDAADYVDRLNAAALPHLEAFLGAVDDHLSPGAVLGVSDEALGPA